MVFQTSQVTSIRLIQQFFDVGLFCILTSWWKVIKAFYCKTEFSILWNYSLLYSEKVMFVTCLKDIISVTSVILDKYLKKLPEPHTFLHPVWKKVFHHCLQTAFPTSLQYLQRPRYNYCPFSFQQINFNYWSICTSRPLISSSCPKAI